MRRDTIRERESERGTEHGKSIYSGKVETTIGNFFFFCASKIAFTHSAKSEKKAIKHKYYQIYTSRDKSTMFRQVCCWEQAAPVGL